MADVEAGSAPAAQPHFVEFRNLRELVAPFYLPAFLLHMLKAMATLMLPLEVLALGFSYDTVGVLLSLMGLGAVLGNMPAGKLVTLMGSRAATVVSALLFAIAALCATLVTMLPPADWTVLILALAFITVGFATSTRVVARSTILGACVRPTLRGRASATLGGFLRAGFTLGPLVAGVVAEYAMSRAVYLLIAVMAVLAGINALLCIPTFDANQSLEPKKAKDAKDIEQLALTAWQVARKHWRVLCISALFMSFLLVCLRARELFFALEGERLELSSSQIGAVTAASFAVDGALFPVAGWMIDRVGRVRTSAISMLGLGASMVLLQGDSFFFYMAFAVVSGLFNGISAGMLQVLSADLAPAHCRGQFIGIFRTLAICADIAGPVFVGAVAELTSVKTAGLLVAATSVFGAAFGLTFMRETAKLGNEVKEALAKPAEIGKKDPEALPVEAGGDRLKEEQI